jgi:hypothetical protein
MENDIPSVADNQDYPSAARNEARHLFLLMGHDSRRASSRYSAGYRPGQNVADRDLRRHDRPRPGMYRHADEDSTVGAEVSLPPFPQIRHQGHSSLR